MFEFEQWEGFKGTAWKKAIDVRMFIQRNYTPYEGDSSFLTGPTERTTALMEKLEKLFAEERAKGGLLDIDTETVSSLLTYAPGYLDKENELIVGLQTDSPLKRGIQPFGGIRMARSACEAYGYKTRSRTLSNTAPHTMTVCSAPTPRK